MRFGGPLFDDCSTPDKWITALQCAGYSAAYCPVDSNQSDDVIQAYAKAAEVAGIVIAEVGAWSNPMSPNDDERSAAISHCQEQLALADKIGARCCVNISGSRGELWAGHHPDNLTDETFDLIIETTRSIIDAVKPKRAFYALETMQWMYPDSADSYLNLIDLIDRKQFAAHLDPVNIVCSPQRYYNNGALIRECFDKLGPYLKSCHAKDIILSEKHTVHLDEIRPGLGNLNYRVYLQELNKLDQNIPLMMEHLPNEDEYKLAADYIRSVAKDSGIKFK